MKPLRRLIALLTLSSAVVATLGRVHPGCEAGAGAQAAAAAAHGSHGGDSRDHGACHDHTTGGAPLQGSDCVALAHCMIGGPVAAVVVASSMPPAHDLPHPAGDVAPNGRGDRPEPPPPRS